MSTSISISSVELEKADVVWESMVAGSVSEFVLQLTSSLKIEIKKFEKQMEKQRGVFADIDPDWLIYGPQRNSEEVKNLRRINELANILKDKVNNYESIETSGRCLIEDLADCEDDSCALETIINYDIEFLTTFSKKSMSDYYSDIEFGLDPFLSVLANQRVENYVSEYNPVLLDPIQLMSMFKKIGKDTLQDIRNSLAKDLHFKKYPDEIDGYLQQSLTYFKEFRDVVLNAFENEGKVLIDVEGDKDLDNFWKDRAIAIRERLLTSGFMVQNKTL